MEGLRNLKICKILIFFLFIFCTMEPKLRIIFSCLDSIMLAMEHFLMDRVLLFSFGVLEKQVMGRPSHPC